MKGNPYKCKPGKKAACTVSTKGPCQQTPGEFPPCGQMRGQISITLIVPRQRTHFVKILPQELCSTSPSTHSETKHRHAAQFTSRERGAQGRTGAVKVPDRWPAPRQEQNATAVDFSKGGCPAQPPNGQPNRRRSKAQSRKGIFVFFQNWRSQGWRECAEGVEGLGEARPHTGASPVHTLKMRNNWTANPPPFSLKCMFHILI